MYKYGGMMSGYPMYGGGYGYGYPMYGASTGGDFCPACSAGFTFSLGARLAQRWIKCHQSHKQTLCINFIGD